MRQIILKSKPAFMFSPFLLVFWFFYPFRTYVICRIYCNLLESQLKTGTEAKSDAVNRDNFYLVFIIMQKRS